MIERFFHRWEHQLATVDTNRLVRPFEWGLDWLGLPSDAPDPLASVRAWAADAVAASDRFFAAEPTARYELTGDRLRFPSALESPFPENNEVVARLFPADARRHGGPARAVVVLPQWNADEGGHVGLCHLFAKFGLTALRLSLPYHDSRRPAELQRADYIVSSNIGRTLHANRQAVLDVRRAVDWLAANGYERIGIIGTSLGSCLSMLAAAHDPRISAAAFNHISPYFADVVWRGLSTRHVRAGLDGHIGADDLRACWLPISPQPFIARMQGQRVRLIYARYDLTFPVDLSRDFVAEFDRRGVPYSLRVLPCGHYTTGKAPFSYLDAYYLTRFFVTSL